VASVGYKILTFGALVDFRHSPRARDAAARFVNGEHDCRAVHREVRGPDLDDSFIREPHHRTDRRNAFEVEHHFLEFRRSVVDVKHDPHLSRHVRGTGTSELSNGTSTAPA